MAKAYHVKIRKKSRKLLHKFLSKLYPPSQNHEPIEAKDIQKILVVRINYRIGNILFMTPLLNALGEVFPEAKIDMIVGASFTKPLIQEMPQIHHVYDFPRRVLKQPLNLLKFKKSLNQNHYDLIINPNPQSSSNSFFTLLIQSRYKLGFFLPDKFSPLTHSIPLDEEVVHEALKPLLLIQKLSLKPLESFPHTLDIKLSKKEKEEATIPPGAIGIFRDARGEKKISNAWWISLLKILYERDNTLKFIDIVDPNTPLPLTPSIEILSEKNLRTLSAKISHLDAFICGDTGPMHLASSVQTPTIALFKTTSPLYYGTLGENDLSLVLKDRPQEEIAHSIITHIQKVKSHAL